jgi:outer membrane receptor protein involved in Fe transport
MQLSSFVDYTFNSKWYASAKLFFVGQRKDLKATPSIANVFPPIYTQEVISLSSYFDLNAQVNYKHNERLTFFFKGNNLANQNYQRWMNYQVQGLQIMLGANYKFDF